MILNEKIIQKMKSRNLSISALEKRAGLKIHAVRNVLKGRVKKPRFAFLLAVAEALDCSPLELMESTPTSKITEIKGGKINNKKFPLDDLNLMKACTYMIISLLEEKKLPFSIDQYAEAVKALYCYSLFGDPGIPDRKFARWLLERDSVF